MPRSVLAPFQPYISRARTLAFGEVSYSSVADRFEIHGALNGEATSEIRKSIEIDIRRKYGIFFTGTSLARRAAAVVPQPFRTSLSISDPSFGAGDLLLAAARRLPLRASLATTIARWGQILVGWEIRPELVELAKIRLLLLARQRHRHTRCLRDDLRLEEMFPNLRCRDGLAGSLANYEKVGWTLLNPPFIDIEAAENCPWATGSVNAAAVFLDRVADHVQPGAIISAILPDVLRSGSRYGRWREHVLCKLKVERTRLVGTFDHLTDVDVVLATFRRLSATAAAGRSAWRTKARLETRGRLGSSFEITVGAVVPHRSPEFGPLRRYICSKGLPTGKEVRRIAGKRQFKGTVVLPPFVVIRRTSRPEDDPRLCATLILGTRPVAVENHLIVCRPTHGGVTVCRRLLSRLRAPEATRFLRDAIRCRHLTVGVLKRLPVNLR